MYSRVPIESASSFLVEGKREVEDRRRRERKTEARVSFGS